jgi:hypothetical protein
MTDHETPWPHTLHSRFDSSPVSRHRASPPAQGRLAGDDPGGRLTVNACATHGIVLVRILDLEGKPLDDLGDAKSATLAGDVLAGERRWPESLQLLRGRPVRLEFRLRGASLFGFEFAT